MLLSQALLVVALKRTILPLAPAASTVGTTGIFTVSFPRLAIVVFFVQVTFAHTCAPHDHPLLVKPVVGPFITHESVSVTL